MAVPLTRKRFTPAEYYALERNAAYKSDYYEGEIFDMSGGTSTHSLISTNVIAALWSKMRDHPCTVYESNMRLAILATGLRTYPDASVYCEPLIYDPEDPENTTATNPSVVFEVLSPSTQAYDRGLKSENYRRVETLKAYALIAQDAAYVQLFERNADGTWSAGADFRGIDSAVTLASLGVTLPLAEIYRRVVFPNSKP
jgi:Uma2 family endonuclease